MGLQNTKEITIYTNSWHASSTLIPNKFIESTNFRNFSDKAKSIPSSEQQLLDVFLSNTPPDGSLFIIRSCKSELILVNVLFLKCWQSPAVIEKRSAYCGWFLGHINKGTHRKKEESSWQNMNLCGTPALTINHSHNCS